MTNLFTFYVHEDPRPKNGAMIAHLHFCIFLNKTKPFQSSEKMFLSIVIYCQISVYFFCKNVIKDNALCFFTSFFLFVFTTFKAHISSFTWTIFDDICPISKRLLCIHFGSEKVKPHINYWNKCQRKIWIFTTKKRYKAILISITA